ncbi:hypothetical protein [Candidatus Williamhamiltonella defendens]|uniref:hypothetical protein n=1 Tax=Candidatus Williamhamiltonella defendens TaxID=138072 RepID=UPI001C9D9301|nr:hypothetical protein [Candidatus Hamiltonella defensa]
MNAVLGSVFLIEEPFVSGLLVVTSGLTAEESRCTIYAPTVIERLFGLSKTC